MSNFDKIDPSICINAKLRRLHRLLNNEYQSKINPYGLRGSMLSIMFIIGKHKGVNHKALSNLLVLDQSTISRDVKKLEAKKWISKSKGIDNRNTEWTITKSGLKLLEEVTPIWQKLQANVEQVLGANKISQIDKLIGSIQKNIEAIAN